MTDKPYVERTGGRYVRDKATGKPIPADRAAGLKPAPEPTLKSDNAEAGSTGRKGK